MLFTKASDYAVRILCYLANTGEAVCRTHSIAEGTGIPESFLAKILGQLGRAGFVRSHRGAHGGFQLVLNAREITMLDVVEAVDGPVAVNLCRGREPCEYQSRCPIEIAWNEAESALRASLRAHTIDVLAASAGQSNAFVLSSSKLGAQQPAPASVESDLKSDGDWPEKKANSDRVGGGFGAVAQDRAAETGIGAGPTSGNLDTVPMGPLRGGDSTGS